MDSDLSELRLGAALRGCAAAAGDLHQGRPQARAHGPAGSRASAAKAISRRARSRRCSTTATTRSMRSHAESLERLGVPRVDILLCHDIGRLTHGDAHAARVREFLDGGYRAMRELRESGAVRAIGLGVNEWRSLRRAARSLRARLHPARRPLHAARAARAARTCCRCASASGVSIICGGPFNSGILAAGSRAGAQAHYNYAAAAGCRARARARGSKRSARNSPCRCRPPRCNFRWVIRPWPASWRAAPTAPRPATRRDVLASGSRRFLARAARARARRCARAAARDMTGHIDSHQHFWRLDRGDYGWLTPAARAYLPRLPAGRPRAAAGARRRRLAPCWCRRRPPSRRRCSCWSWRSEHAVHRRRRGLGGFRELHGGRVDRHARRRRQARRAAPNDPGHPRHRVDARAPIWRPPFEAMIDHGLVFDALVLPKHLPALLDLAGRVSRAAAWCWTMAPSRRSRRRHRRVEARHRRPWRATPMRLQTVGPGHRGRQRGSRRSSRAASITCCEVSGPSASCGAATGRCANWCVRMRSGARPARVARRLDADGREQIYSGTARRDLWNLNDFPARRRWSPRPASGIGRASAEAFARAGARVIAADIDAGRIEARSPAARLTCWTCAIRAP